MVTASQEKTDFNRGSLALVGYGLGTVPLLAVLALLHHPVGHGQQAVDILASVRSQTRMDQIVHATLTTIYGFLASCMVLFAERLGLKRFVVVLGLVAFLFACLLTALAALTDGFVIPAIAARCEAGASPACASEAVSMARLSAMQIEYLTRFSFVGVAVATASWSIALLWTKGLPRWPGTLGSAFSVCQVSAMLAATGPLAPANLLIIFSGQVAWYLLAASLMIKQQGPFGGRRL